MIVSVEIGGTFTDIIRQEDDGRQRIFKVPSTPENPAIGAINGVRTAIGDDFSGIKAVFHGSTIATNAVIEHKYKTTGLLTTKGFRDILEIQRQDRRDVYDIFYQKPRPLVRREKVKEIAERIDLKGEIIQPLDENEVLAAAKSLVKKKGITSIAVSFLYSYVNPVHELKVKEIIGRSFPSIPVILSSEVIPEFREYERTSTVVLSAYVKPIVKDYITYMKNALFKSSFRGSFYIMQSNGGILEAPFIEECPAQMFFSGPAAGVTGAVFLSEKIGVKNLMTMDMGGTSSDVCLVTNGHPEITTFGDIDGLPLKLPIMDIVTVGSGGGSIGWVDEGGMPRVGPLSAGANPGPACYGKGGKEPTVTDALLILGLITDEGFLGGKMRLKRSPAEKAIISLGKKLDMDLFQTADSIFKIGIANVTQAMRLASIERGYDPRDYTLCTYGGCGPLHSAYLAKGLDMHRVIIPMNPAVFSAFGLLASNIRRDYVITRISLVKDTDPGEIKKIFSKLKAQAKGEFQSFGISRRQQVYITSLDMRYEGQGYELDVPFNLRGLQRGGPETLERLFHKFHLSRYGNASEEEVQIVNYRLTVVGIRDDVIALPVIPTNLSPRWIERSIFLEGERYSCKFYERATLPAGFESGGPAVIQEDYSATLVPPGWRFSIASQGYISLREG